MCWAHTALPIEIRRLKKSAKRKMTAESLLQSQSTLRQHQKLSKILSPSLFPSWLPDSFIVNGYTLKHCSEQFTSTLVVILMAPKQIDVKIPNGSSPIAACISIPTTYDKSKADQHHLVILTHGAGGDMNNDFLVKLADYLASNGILCLRFTCSSLNLPVRVKAFHAAISFVKQEYPVKSLIVSGRSMGSRAALGCANESPEDCVGVLFLAYPLHRPGDLKNLRDQPLYELCRPALFVSGTNDAMCNLPLLHETLAKQKRKDEYAPEFHFIDGGDHSFKVKGGKAANEKITNAVLKISLNWCSKIFGITSSDADLETLTDPNSEISPSNDKKRKRADDSQSGAASSPKKPKTLESFFTKQAAPPKNSTTQK